jgi:GNAT superfamily N-acetyltransferase
MIARAESRQSSEIATGRASTRDLDDLVALERVAWPDRACMRAARATFELRVSMRGVWLARDEDGRVVGSLSTFRPRWARSEVFDELRNNCPDFLFALPTALRWRALCSRFQLPANWHAATDDGRLAEGQLHDDHGAVLFGVGVATDPRVRGRSIASALLDAALRDAQQCGALYFVGYSRLPLYHRHGALELSDYIRTGVQRNGRWVPHDHGFRLHWSLGAQPLSSRSGRVMYQGIPGAMQDDPESRNAGVLIITPLVNRRTSPFDFSSRPRRFPAGL